MRQAQEGVTPSRWTGTAGVRVRQVCIGGGGDGARSTLHARWFAGRLVTCEFTAEDEYDAAHGVSR